MLVEVKADMKKHQREMELECYDEVEVSLVGRLKRSAEEMNDESDKELESI